MYKRKIKNILKKIRNIIILIASKSRFLSKVFFFISSDFDREFEYTLKGRINSLNHKFTDSRSNAYIRRCVHRLEKGLFHEAPKNKFGKDLFLELENEIYNYDIKKMDWNELNWLIETLKKYKKYAYFPKKVDHLLGFLSENEGIEKKSEIKTNYSEFITLKEVLLRRKSVRFYSKEIVDVNLIKQCVDISRYVPSACNRQPYHIELLTKKDQILHLGKMAPGTKGWIEDVPVLGVVIGHSNSFRATRDRHLIYFDSGLFISNFVNSLATVNLNSCICNWTPDWKNDREAIKYLGYDLSKTIVCLIAIGHSKGIKSPVSTKKSINNLLRIR